MSSDRYDALIRRVARELEDYVEEKGTLLVRREGGLHPHPALECALGLAALRLLDAAFKRLEEGGRL